MAKRVLLAGLYHESHTFLDGVTPLEAFALRRGAALLAERGGASPLSGALEVAERCGWQVVPAVDLRSGPGATAADEVLETFWREIEACVRGAEALDGVFLVLHGAMVTESQADVEGEVLERLRALPSIKEVPVGGILDLHANVSERLAALGDCFLAYRENPHADAKQASADAARLLDRLMTSGERPRTVRAQPAVLWPPTGTATAEDPMRALEAQARALESASPELLAVNVFAGFSYADVPHAGPAFTAVTLGDAQDAQRKLQELCGEATRRRAEGIPQESSVAKVMAALATLPPPGAPGFRGPAVIAEPSDNIGGGAPGDGTGLLRAFVEHRVEGAAVALCDPHAVKKLAALSAGTRAELALGGRGSRFDAGPLKLSVELLTLSDGRFGLEDPQSHLASMSGGRFEMGPCAVVRHAGVTILLTSRPTPPFDLGQWRSQGLAPEGFFALGVKAAVAHRRAYDGIAGAHFRVATPGPCPGNLAALPYRRLRQAVFPVTKGS
ncbi:MAG: M81 family metallopeptidase [Planctomycetes bacterium]|nr:M81 family metallopeptidase [Planctomycetota bacterium]